MSAEIQQQKDFYDKYWQGLEPLGAYKVQRMKWIADALVRIRKKLNGRDIQLLDMGCGDGRLTPLWNSIAGGTAHGLELSPQAVATAQKMFPFVRYKEGDATDTGYENGKFNVIICQEVLEHVEQQEVLIKECARISGAGGYLILTTPNKYYFDRREGGNYSQQPIENIIDRDTLRSLLSPYFEIQSFESLIYAKGDKGIYKIITNRYLLAVLNRAGLLAAWKKYLLYKGYGLHIAAVCIKK